MGRQPWVVYGLLKTSDALSKVVTANQIIFSLILFTLVYIVLFALFLFLLNRKIQHGPIDYGTKERIEEGTRRDNPLLEHSAYPNEEGETTREPGWKKSKTRCA